MQTTFAPNQPIRKKRKIIAQVQAPQGKKKKQKNTHCLLGFSTNLKVSFIAPFRLYLILRNV